MPTCSDLRTGRAEMFIMERVPSILSGGCSCVNAPKRPGQMQLHPSPAQEVACQRAFVCIIRGVVKARFRNWGTFWSILQDAGSTAGECSRSGGVSEALRRVVSDSDRRVLLHLLLLCITNGSGKVSRKLAGSSRVLPRVVAAAERRVAEFRLEAAAVKKSAPLEGVPAWLSVALAVATAVSHLQVRS